MRILLICNKMPYPKHDGGSVAIYNMAVSLSSLGHEVRLLAMLTEKHSLSGTDPVFSEKKITIVTFPVSTRINWQALLRNFFFSRMPYVAERFISAPFNRELTHMLQLHAFDVVQLEGAYMLPYAHTVRSHSNALIAFRSHNTEHIIWENLAGSMINPLKKAYFHVLAKRLKKFEKDFLGACDLLIPMSRVDEIIYEAMGNRKPVKVCPVGWDMEDLPDQNTGECEKCLFFLGSLDWIPNQEALLWLVSKVFPTLRDNHPGLVLYVAGRNAPFSLVNKLQAIPRITFCGEVKNSGEFMHNKGIMVAPLFSGSGIRVKIIEAMALGKPVVATAKAAEGIEVTPDTNILLADQAKDFILQTERLLQDPRLYDRISINSAKLAREKYDSMKISEGLVTFYQNHLR